MKIFDYRILWLRLFSAVFAVIAVAIAFRPALDLQTVPAIAMANMEFLTVAVVAFVSMALIEARIYHDIEGFVGGLIRLAVRGFIGGLFVFLLFTIYYTGMYGAVF